MAITFGVMTLVGAGINAYGQKKAGDAQAAAGRANREAANSQANLSDFNAEMADLQAQDAVARGDIDASRFRQTVNVMIGAQRAAQAANNVDVGFGSSVDVQADTRYLGEIDASTIRTNAAREAWGFRVNAADLREQARIERKTGVALAATGAAQQTASNLAAAGTLVTAGTSLLQQRYGMTH
jgi:hypothetical protein